MVRCPVCEGTAVTIVLNSRPRASCGSCGATWIQEGSWQRAIRPGQTKLPVVAVSAHAAAARGPTVTLEEVEQDVIVLPDRVHPPRLPLATPPEEAIAT